MIDNFFPLKKSDPIFDRSDGSKRPIGDQPVENNSQGGIIFIPAATARTAPIFYRPPERSILHIFKK